MKNDYLRMSNFTMKMKHICPICGRNQICYYDTWLCPKCNWMQIDDLTFGMKYYKKIEREKERKKDR